jgi:hypothetical protein
VEERWIVLVDVSASLDQTDRQLSREVRNPAYRLRSELLSLLQVFLGAMDDVDARRNGFLKVEFFGHGVESASGLPTWPLHWEDAKDEAWWNAAVPQSLSGRTEFMPALSRAAEEFAGMNPLARKHLLIVSDGELDVGPLDRGRGVPFGDEERKAYAEMMSPDNPTVAKLRTLNVKVDAIVIDPVAVSSGSERQETVRKKLLSTNEPTIPQQFQRLLNDLENAIASTGRQPYSEGPYFLYALTEMFGGQSRPVQPGNLGDVVWHTAFPDAVSAGAVPPGSRSLVILSKAEDPVRLCFDENGGLRDLTLRYNRARNDYSREPINSTDDVRVRHHATSRYVTWLINAPAVTCVDPPAAYYGNNVELSWLTDDKPSAGRPLPIELQLTRSPSGEDQGPSIEWWRSHLAQRISAGSVKATANVSLPDGSRTLGIPLKVGPAMDAHSILDLRGHLSRVDSPGSYVVSVRLTDVEQGWEETAEPTTIVVAPESWWPAGASGPRLAILGGLVCCSLLFVYRDQLKDFSSTPQAPFDFAIRNAGETTVTKQGQRKAIRFIVGEESIRIDIGRRAVGNGPTAVLAPTDRSSLSYRLCGSGHGWEYRQTFGGKMPGEYVPLGERGVEISLLYFVQRSTVDLRHGDHVVRISHSSYVS